jgi:hypothetical protein
MKKPKGKGKKPNAPKPKNTKQKQRQSQSVNVKINIGQTKNPRAHKGTTKLIPSYSPQPITSYSIFREEPPPPPIIRNQEPTHTPTQPLLMTTRESDTTAGLRTLLGQTPMDRWRRDTIPSNHSSSRAPSLASIYSSDSSRKSVINPMKRVEQPPTTPNTSFRRSMSREPQSDLNRIESIYRSPSPSMSRNQLPPLTRLPLPRVRTEEQRLRDNALQRERRAKAKEAKKG